NNLNTDLFTSRINGKFLTAGLLRLVFSFAKSVYANTRRSSPAVRNFPFILEVNRSVLRLFAGAKVFFFVKLIIEAKGQQSQLKASSYIMAIVRSVFHIPFQRKVINIVRSFKGGSADIKAGEVKIMRAGKKKISKYFIRKNMGPHCADCLIAIVQIDIGIVCKWETELILSHIKSE